MADYADANPPYEAHVADVALCTSERIAQRAQRVQISSEPS